MSEDNIGTGTSRTTYYVVRPDDSKPGLYEGVSQHPSTVRGEVLWTSQIGELGETHEQWAADQLAERVGGEVVTNSVLSVLNFGPQYSVVLNDGKGSGRDRSYSFDLGIR